MKNIKELKTQLTKIENLIAQTSIDENLLKIEFKNWNNLLNCQYMLKFKNYRQIFDNKPEAFRNYTIEKNKIKNQNKKVIIKLFVKYKYSDPWQLIKSFDNN